MMGIEVDLSRREVLLNGMPTQNVTINKSEISFIRDLGPAGLWAHKINRMTGDLIIQIPANYQTLPTPKCGKAQAKF